MVGIALAPVVNASCKIDDIPLADGHFFSAYRKNTLSVQHIIEFMVKMMMRFTDQTGRILDMLKPHAAPQKRDGKYAGRVFGC